MKRHEVITLIGGTAAWPLVRAQQAIPVIGVLDTGGKYGVLASFQRRSW
jgi:hypothetical protein